MSRSDPEFRLRIPPDMKAEIRKAAERNRRSMTAEILSRLQTSLDTDEAFEGVSADDPLSMMRAGTKVMEATLKSFEKGIVALEIERKLLESEDEKPNSQ